MSLAALKEAVRQLSPNEKAELVHYLVDQLAKGEQPVMSEERYWQLIELLDWSQEGHDDAVLAPAVHALSRHTEAEIEAFADLQARLLRQLDGETYADHYREAPAEGFSADLFLYARCAVVANGKEVYYQVLQHPEQMPKDVDFEALLSLPARAYEQKTGNVWAYVPRYNYETGFNEGGWGADAIRL